ncbi:FAD/NAD(P)-binding protein [Roseimaritima ulvae]|uniref:Pyridine nucleotide-disulfide oxidoreductase n=1 Tax=Roseimaritima ulvae TaxID=980254 RepID=A0A5B9R2Z1_9BACT|nr:FAD/NAD(P)-binding protein [Roseimaritima ulvae]QEG43826.1 Pyridine nucleotide-disulfide oxidoreductase [Roseimaritima ulvae]
MQTTVIIGGGFSGTLTAVQLVRHARSPHRVVLVNSGRAFGRGTAYGTTRSEHLLNVAARNMSAFPDQPDHFFQWLRSRSDFDAMDDRQLRETFVPRRIYGDYIRSIALHYLNPADPRNVVQTTILPDTAVDIEPRGRGGIVMLQEGEPIEAESILLATGNQPPAGLPGSQRIANDRRYIANPWNPWHEQLPPKDAHLVILGTGLTAVDVIVTLRHLGWSGRITAISRNGLLPQRHFRGIQWPDAIGDDGQTRSLKELSTLIRQDCQRLRGASQNPAIAIDKLRGRTQALWKSLSVEERQRFLRHYAAQWNVLRHRIAGPIHDAVTDAIDAGQLTVLQATIEGLSANERHLQIHLAGEGDTPRTIDADMVINCTGPKARFSDTTVPLYQNLFQRGVARPDAMDMGLAVDDSFALQPAEGHSTAAIYAIGPLLKGTLWESVAVPELRGQAMQVARTILQQQPDPLPQSDLIEYCI